jgi:hypothetical protein
VHRGLLVGCADRITLCTGSHFAQHDLLSAREQRCTGGWQQAVANVSTQYQPSSGTELRLTVADVQQQGEAVEVKHADVPAQQSTVDQLERGSAAAATPDGLSRGAAEGTVLAAAGEQLARDQQLQQERARQQQLQLDRERKEWEQERARQREADQREQDEWRAERRLEQQEKRRQQDRAAHAQAEWSAQQERLDEEKAEAKAQRMAQREHVFQLLSVQDLECEWGSEFVQPQRWLEMQLMVGRIVQPTDVLQQTALIRWYLMHSIY